MNCRITDSWDDQLALIPPEKRDIYFDKDYVSLYDNEVDSARCAVVEDGDRIILMPFLQRKIGSYYDFETAYGFGGPATNCEDVS